MDKYYSPRFARWIISLLSKFEKMDSLIFEMEDEYLEIFESEGRKRAHKWYWLQTFKSIPRFLKFSFDWGKSMFSNYLKIALRNIIKKKEFAFINIIGLAAGMACSIVIMLWVWDEYSYDKFNKYNTNIFRITSDWEKWDWDGLPLSPGSLGPAVKEEIPGITDYVRIIGYDRAVFKYNNNIFYEKNGVIVDPSIFTVFSFPLKNGTPDDILTSPESIVISETFAKKYFGNENPFGKQIDVDGELKNVTGVFYDLPKNSHLTFDFAVSFEFLSEHSNYSESWSAFNFTTYLLLGDKTIYDLSSISSKMVKTAKSNKCSQVEGGVTFNLQPLNDVHLYDFGWETNYTRIGDSTQVYIFMMVAVFILFIACINFTNLSTARAVNRSKEVGLRKTIGANKSQLIFQFIAESLLMVTIATIIAILLVEAILPSFNTLSGKEITTEYSNPVFIGVILVIILLTGLLSGSYPAFYLSSFNPVTTLTKRISSVKGGSSFRKVLVVFQFSLSIILILVTMLIYKQIDYSKNIKLGIEKENVVFIPLLENLSTKYEVMKTELLKNPFIKEVSAHGYNLITDPTPRAAGFKWAGMPEERERSLDLIWSGVDYRFFELLKIEPVEGEIFSENFTSHKDGVILNEAAIAEMGLENPIGKWITLDDWKKTIIGVVKNVHFKSTKKEIDPRVFYLRDYSTEASGIMLIKIDGQHTEEIMSYIEDKWNIINNISPFEYGFIEDDYENLYKSETKIAKIFSYFTSLAILISCLGLFGLSLFAAEQQKKAVGIRKVLGASTVGIILLMSKEFVKWILVANVIAWPIAYLFIDQWLQNFVYKTEIGILPFLIAGISAVTISLATISFQSIKAASENPIESIKYE